MVTGASHGIGPLIATALEAAGYTVIRTARTAAESDGVWIKADLTRPEEVERLAREAEAVHGHVDVLVNNAGGDPQLEFDAMSWRQNQAIIELNALAPIHLTHALLPGMLARKQGHIVNISSIAGRVSFPYAEAYAAAKDGLIAFTRVLRNDYRAAGVSASAVILGAIRDAGQGERTAKEVGLDLPKMGTTPASEVAKAVLHAIRKDRAELVVMPGPGRLIRAVMDLFPGLGPAMNRAVGADRAMRRVIDFRTRRAAEAR